MSSLYFTANKIITQGTNDNCAETLRSNLCTVLKIINKENLIQLIFLKGMRLSFNTAFLVKTLLQLKCKYYNYNVNIPVFLYSKCVFIDFQRGRGRERELERSMRNIYPDASCTLPAPTPAPHHRAPRGQAQCVFL